MSEGDGGQPCSGWLVVEADAHEGHGLDDAETVGEAPAQQSGVAGGDENSRAAEGVGRGDEGLHVQVGFGDGVGEETERGGVAGNSAVALGDAGGWGGSSVGALVACFDGLGEIASAVVAVYTQGEVAAGFEVSELGGADGGAGEGPFSNLALEAAEGFADIESQ